MHVRTCVRDVCDSANVSPSRARVDCRHCCKLHGVLICKNEREFRAPFLEIMSPFIHARLYREVIIIVYWYWR